MTSQSSRRRFLKAGASVALGAAVAETVHAAPARAPGWDESFDIIVVGSGIAATSAAVTAANAGAKVVMLEKMPVFGGTSALSDGTMAVVGSPQQKARGIAGDSWERLYQDILEEGDYYSQPALAEKLARDSILAYEFHLANGGRFEDYVIPFPGMSVNRILQPSGGCAKGLLRPLWASFRRRGGAMRTRCKVDAVVLDDKGAAIGVRVRDNYRFDPLLASDDIDNKSGTVRLLRARQGIICGTGGFMRDRPFVAQEFPQFKFAQTTQNLGQTASGYRLLANAGARMGHTPFYRPAFPQANNMGLGIMIDVATGRRYTSETIGRKAHFVAAARLMSRNGGRIPIAILDAGVFDMIVNKPRLQFTLNSGDVVKLDSLDEIAARFDIPRQPFLESIRKYNEMAEAGKDTEFGRDFTVSKQNRVGKPPFYVALVRPDQNSNQGGAFITPKAEVIGLNTNAGIPGLYAAGEATGGVLGASRLLGCAILNGSVFGITAGREAAARKA